VIASNIQAVYFIVEQSTTTTTTTGEGKHDRMKLDKQQSDDTPRVYVGNFLFLETIDNNNVVSLTVSVTFDLTTTQNIVGLNNNDLFDR
jgi:hypothetical protein